MLYYFGHFLYLFLLYILSIVKSSLRRLCFDASISVALFLWSYACLSIFNFHVLMPLSFIDFTAQAGRMGWKDSWICTLQYRLAFSAQRA